MSNNKLKELIPKLNDLGSLRDILKELNYTRVEKPVSTENWSEDERNGIAEQPLIIAEKKNFKVFYLKANRDTCVICQKIASKINKENNGLCLVCSQSSTGKKWSFSAQAKRHETSDTKTRHVEIEIDRGIEIDKNVIGFLEDIRIPLISTKTITTAHIMNMMCNALERFEIPANMAATKLMTDIYDHLSESCYDENDMEILLTRLLYCVFAEDTGIFKKSDNKNNLFFDWLINMKPEKNDLGKNLMKLFDILNTKENERPKPANLKSKDIVMDFPFVNGGLFQDKISIPKTDQKIKELLIAASRFDWHGISPSIFGSLFQNIMNKKERRESGAHYTSEENILKVIKPLFLDDLYDEFSNILKLNEKIREKKLKQFHEKLSKLTFFDPACGAGNFLIITYRELRRLELEVIKNYVKRDQKNIPIKSLSKVNVNQFYGIEIKSFSVKIAKTALWMMDHLMNLELAEHYGEPYNRIPLEEQPHIIAKDALEFDWNEHLPAKKCSYVFGNPPFSGERTRTKKQSEQTQQITGLSRLDYVCNWFVKTSNYLGKCTVPFAFVATSSITQGVQVNKLFPILLVNGLEISFAYTSFLWSSETKDSAAVAVVIIGFSKHDKEKRLFTVDRDGHIVESNPNYITPYLTGSDERQETMVLGKRKPINGLPEITSGCRPIDDWNYIFSDSELKDFLDKERGAKSLIHPYITAKDFLNNNVNYIILFENIKNDKLEKLLHVKKRIKAVKKYRKTHEEDAVRNLADTPMKYARTHIPKNDFLAIPRTTSERRQYLPIGFLKPPTLIADPNMYVDNASIELFALLSSRMHMIWVQKYGGKMKKDPSYTYNKTYNVFPVPKDYSSLAIFGQEILNVRNEHSDLTLVDMYDPDTMPEDLRTAHKNLDQAVEKLYNIKPFKDDKDRLDCMLEKYKEMVEKHQELMKTLKKKQSKEKQVSNKKKTTRKMSSNKK